MPKTAPRTAKPTLTLSDLDWFDIRRYDRKMLNGLGLPGWISILQGRLTIKDKAESGDPEALTMFKEVMGDPSTGTGFGALRTASNLGHSDQASVRLLSVGEVARMHDMATDAEASPSSPYDGAVPVDIAGGREIFRHIRVDLTATKKRIVEDFQAFLNEEFKSSEQATNGNYGKTVIAEWVDSRYLPYFDLNLYGLIMDRRISMELYAKKLGFITADGALAGTGKSDVPEFLRGPRGSLKRFNSDTLAAMTAEAGGR